MSISVARVSATEGRPSPAGVPSSPPYMLCHGIHDKPKAAATSPTGLTTVDCARS